MTSPLAISIIWAIYNAIPPVLVLFYAVVGKGVLLQYLCRFCMLLSFFCGATAIGLLWGLYPKVYNFNQVSCALSEELPLKINRASPHMPVSCHS